MIYPKIIKEIKDSKSIAIVSHLMPDGDNLGSCLALYTALKNYGKNVKVIIDDNIPKLYMFLAGINEIERPNPSYRFDLLIALDCGDPERLGKCANYIKQGTTVINIDHHISNTGYGNLNMVDSNAAATGEMVYQIIKIMGIDMNKDISECLYTAIVTDTGQFQYSNTTSITHQIAGDLLNNGVSAPNMYKKIYQTSTKDKVVLLSKALATMQFHFDDRVAGITLDSELVTAALGKDSDTEGVINYARDVDTVEVAYMLKELVSGKVKASFRSKEYVDVMKIATYFGGGGHKKAAGCTIFGSLEEARNQILEQVSKELR